MCRRALVVCLLLLACSGTVDAQAVAAGARVRIWSTRPSLSKEEGTVVARQGDTLLIERRRGAQPDYSKAGPLMSDTVHIAWNALRRLEVWQGKSHARGALKGFLIGIGSGLAVGRAFDWARRNEAERYPIPAMPVLGVLGALAGTFLGAIVGSERWQRVHP